MALQNVISKEIRRNEFETEIRYFAETDDGFDGTAQGYGYKSIEKLKKAYWWYKEGDAWKKKVQNRRNNILTYFRTTENSDELYGKLIDFFHPDNMIYLIKDGDAYDRKSLLNCYSNIQKPLDELLQSLHIKFSSLIDFFTSLYEEEEILKERYIEQMRKSRKKWKKLRKITKIHQRLIEQYGREFIEFRKPKSKLSKKLKKYCIENKVQCPETKAKMFISFKQLPTEKQEIIRNTNVG